MKHSSSIVWGIYLMGCISIGYAEDYSVADFRGSTPTSDEVVEALKPPPALKVRGIVIHGNTSGSQSMPQEKPKALSMQISFNSNSAELTPDAKEKLDVVAKALGSVELANYRFKIEGHTDSAGSAAYNRKLSQRRAQSVARYMSQNYGIKPNRLEAVGKGMSQPANPADPKAPENRRVVIVNAGGL